ncbi:TPA: hypothetical protein JLG89_003846 [Escherichia coli]|nr:hypothetical protein [Escherichia coli]
MVEKEQHTAPDDKQNKDTVKNQKSITVKDSNMHFDIAGFMLAGNLMIKLIENGVINMHDVYDVIRHTQTSYNNRRTFDDLGFDADEYINLLLHKLWDSRPDAINVWKLSSEQKDTDAVE